MKNSPLDIELVREFIIAAHGDFEMVKKLITKEPALIHSVMNWGANDWESGIGAAAHTGSRDIAKWLLEHGARMDIFAAAMLGELKIVQAMIDSQPDVIHATGPHGIPLIRHAQMGGEPAVPVYEYLESLTMKEEV
ncbi:ankyrin repeat domain-containing protein [Lederbergia lenta]|uniref:Ankyrin repeat domain protein n=1 Tax=Lederbergia lenta TaxID=1467 RepID=A0A2X4WYD9_LEDLE|nr:ankyrin repeat domain-containing protein [Lederbergia lenta]MEC2323095.1 ankyrin repeat domain-containing protein [Lederbergia lenta]SQI62710.1 ankyrin repeat domain protein [Lederbergia lenta]